jgi:hypothetical protein
MSAGKTTANLRLDSYGYGTVNLAVAGLPSGVSASLSSKSLVSGRVAITLTAAKGTKTQTVPITIWATSGSRVHYIMVDVNVTSS